MERLLRLGTGIDRVLSIVARIGAWAGLGLMIVVIYDVVTRYFGVPKFFGLNATKLQESEYWLHTFLFTLMIGYAYTRQSHVRIDLIRDRLSRTKRYWIEAIGCILFLIPYCVVAGWVTFNYAMRSFEQGEISKSVIGLTHIWILKSSMTLMFLLLGLAGVSQLIKAIAGLAGKLPEDKVMETLGGDH